MDKLKKILEAEVEKIPRKLLRQNLKKKLKEKGVKDKGAIEALSDHVLSGKSEPFKLDDRACDPGEEITIQFTKQDGDEILEAMGSFLDEGLPRVINESIEDSARNLVERLEIRWPEIKLDERYAAQYFSERIDLRWSRGLDPLQMMLITSREIGEAFSEKLRKSKAKKGIFKRQALMLLHVRACQTTLEVLTLIKSGLPDGAYARWRTLYEISVAALFIDRFGDEAAWRYISHDIVSTRDYLFNEYKFAGREYDLNFLEGEERQIEKDYLNVIKKFGDSFKGPYGWAASSLNCSIPDDHIDPRRTALFMARSILRGYRDGRLAC